jgi:hypothetical protein
MSGWDEHGRWQWGKAGVRRTPTELDALELRRRAQAAAHAHAVAQAEQEAHDAWTRGLLAPWRITLALDRRALYGPAVDEACGTREPAVDLWEAGLLYPTWDQVLALSKLTGFGPAFFIHRDGTGPIRISDTSLRFHTKGPLDDPPPVLAFTAEAIAATLDGGACSICGLTDDPAGSPADTAGAIARAAAWCQATASTPDQPAPETIPGLPGVRRSDLRTLIQAAAAAANQPAPKTEPTTRKKPTHGDQPALF